MSARVSAVVVLAVGGALTAFTSFGIIGLLREGVRYGCHYTEEGEGQGWFCADGNGYLLPGLGVLLLLVIAGGIAIGLAVGAAELQVALPGVAAMPLAIGLLASLSGLVWAGPSGDTRYHLEAWVGSMIVAGPALVAAGLLAIAASVATGRGDARQFRVLTAASAVVALVAAIAQPGLTAPFIAALSILAAGLIVRR